MLQIFKRRGVLYLKRIIFFLKKKKYGIRHNERNTLNLMGIRNIKLSKILIVR